VPAASTAALQRQRTRRAAVRWRPQTGFAGRGPPRRTDGITYNLLGDQIDIGRTEGDLLFEDPHLAPGTRASSPA
jgi:hypothetical protein